MNVVTPDRETWLRQFAVDLIASHPVLFSAVDLTKVRIGVGFPGGGSRTKRIGEAWHPEASADGTSEVIISPLLGDGRKAADTLAHELCHVQCNMAGTDRGHGAGFRHVARGIGLEGKLTATEGGPEFWAVADPILEALGPYPHAALTKGTTKKQGTRMLKCECESCGFVFRTTAKWVEGRSLHCPDAECGGFVNVV